ncbi:MAG: hypothetical protein JWO92_1120 [Chitinophagaceae bacterium]|nr:hypothetical protein [Chitinophagaceae bacterium]
MANVKYPPDPFIKWFTIALLALMLSTAFASCSAVKQVLSDPKKKEIVGREWEKQNPCTNTIKPGKDSIIRDTIRDSKLIKVVSDNIDSLLNIYCKVSTPLDLDSLKNKIRRDVLKDCKPEYHLRVDTVVDHRRERLLEKDISNRDGQITQLKEDNKKLEADKKVERKRGNKFLEWLIIAGIVFGVTRFIKYRYKVAWL